jgi:hypothetical protein
MRTTIVLAGFGYYYSLYPQQYNNTVTTLIGYFCLMCALVEDCQSAFGSRKLYLSGQTQSKGEEKK